jgi:hypothetical protein
MRRATTTGTDSRTLHLGLTRARSNANYDLSSPAGLPHLDHMTNRREGWAATPFFQIRQYFRVVRQNLGRMNRTQEVRGSTPLSSTDGPDSLVLSHRPSERDSVKRLDDYSSAPTSPAESWSWYDWWASVVI